MKVYLLYSFYDDGPNYDSLAMNCDDLIKIVDSEEKAKKWIFEQAVKKCNELVNSGGEEEMSFYLNQLDKLKFGGDWYTIYDFNRYEKYGFKYETMEVE